MFGNTRNNSFWSTSGQQNAPLFGNMSGTTTGSTSLFGNTSGTTNTTSGSLFGSNTGTSTSTGLFGTTTNNTTGGLFGSNNATSTTGTGLFGNTTGTSTTTSGGLFGNMSGTTTGSTSLFGNTSGTTNTTAFNQITGNEVATSITTDGDTVNNVAFGQKNSQEEYRWEYYKRNDPNFKSNTTGGLFGSNNATSTTGTGLFGNTTGTSTTTSGGLFGNMSGTTTGSTSLFGNTSGTTNTTSGSLFGSNTGTSTSTGLFGTTTNNTTGGLFGSNNATSTTGTGLFGNTTGTSTTTSGGLFGNMSGTTTGSTSLFGNTSGTTNTTSGSLFGSNTGTSTSTGLFGTTTNNTTGGLFGSNNATSTTGTGLFGNTTGTSTTTSGGLFGNMSGTTTGSTSLFGNTSGTTNTTSGSLFGSNTGTSTSTGLFGTTTNNTTGGLFGSNNATSTTGTGLFGNTTGTSTTTSGGLFGNMSGTTTGSTSLFGNTSGTTNTTSGSLFGSNTGTSTSTGLFGTTTNNTNGQVSKNISRVGNFLLNWDFGAQSPGVASFWSTHIDIPVEAQEHLKKLSELRNKNQLLSHESTISTRANPSHKEIQDRFGLRKILKDLGIQTTRYSLPQQYFEIDSTPTKVINEWSFSTQSNNQMEDKLTEGFSTLPVRGASKNYYSGTEIYTTEKFIPLHNGGINEIESLRFYATAGKLTDLNTESNVPDQIFTFPNFNSDKDLTLDDISQRGRNRGHLDDIYKLKGSNITNEMTALHSEIENTTMDVSTTTNPPTLSKPKYTTKPTIESLQLMNDKQLSEVLDFQIIHDEYGDILWPGYTDLRSLNLDEIIDISYRKITAYSNTAMVHPVGRGLNKDVIITFRGCVPQNFDERQSITSQVSKMEKLKRYTESIGGKFILANFRAGIWTFSLPYFISESEIDKGKHSPFYFEANLAD
ncbi:hypothetical protein BEWA_009920 [Theileria equi strain WA]|uniref:Peptidase S59 domain-containing protein n=1 Tax=Theileria equi strain WA TaxID=1537102 RepID=L0B253_THEEQ|nr:hypothetical protein BEWA_009920 [Theileria equi strain WA]AFZ81578.1 hypothetical protein BEWA_009920 [Theileria equi strain WA]|eukprot:XP_004831244.1 hypothetical protein BEWA_009920 [Theileria equi strain WA]